MNETGAIYYQSCDLDTKQEHSSPLFKGVGLGW